LSVISAQTRPAFVAREDRFSLFRIMLLVGPELFMQKLFRLVAAALAAALIALPSGLALAQGAPSGETAPAPPPAATPRPALEPAAPDKAAESASPERKSAPKKKKTARMTRQQEVDRSVERGTVPARYRNSVPKEYHQYIPFDKQ
jgi:hypothetical protein